MQEGTRVLAVSLSNEVFDKLDDYVILGGQVLYKVRMLSGNRYDMYFSQSLPKYSQKSAC